MVEVVRTLEAYRTTDPEFALDRMVIGGSCGVEEALSAAAGARLKAPVSLYAPPAELTGRVASPPQPLSFGAAIGLALGHTTISPQSFDFLHPKEPG